MVSCLHLPSPLVLASLFVLFGCSGQSPAGSQIEREPAEQEDPDGFYIEFREEGEWPDVADAPNATPGPMREGGFCLPVSASAAPKNLPLTHNLDLKAVKRDGVVVLFGVSSTSRENQADHMDALTAALKTKFKGDISTEQIQHGRRIRITRTSSPSEDDDGRSSKKRRDRGKKKRGDSEEEESELRNLTLALLTAPHEVLAIGVLSADVQDVILDKLVDQVSHQSNSAPLRPTDRSDDGTLVAIESAFCGSTETYVLSTPRLLPEPGPRLVLNARTGEILFEAMIEWPDGLAAGIHGFQSRVGAEKALFYPRDFTATQVQLSLDKRTLAEMSNPGLREKVRILFAPGSETTAVLRRLFESQPAEASFTISVESRLASSDRSLELAATVQPRRLRLIRQ